MWSEAYTLEEEVQLRVGVGILGHFKQWVEYVVQQLLKVLNDALLLVNVVQPWQLHIHCTILASVHHTIMLAAVAQRCKTYVNVFHVMSRQRPVRNMAADRAGVPAELVMPQLCTFADACHTDALCCTQQPIHGRANVGNSHTCMSQRTLSE